MTISYRNIVYNLKTMFYHRHSLFNHTTYYCEYQVVHKVNKRIIKFPASQRLGHHRRQIFTRSCRAPTNSHVRPNIQRSKSNYKPRRNSEKHHKSRIPCKYSINFIWIIFLRNVKLFDTKKLRVFMRKNGKGWGIMVNAGK